MRPCSFITLLIVVLITAGAYSAGARAENAIEQFLTPGPVVTGHAKFETNCDSCHEPFSRAAQDGLCLDCHKPVRADIAAKTGFHGKSRLMTGVACSSCHTDHEGRDADIEEIDTAAFDHSITDFPLSGSHHEVACGGCHIKGKRWAEAATTCFACHEAEQPHRGNLGKECQTCHRDTAWRDTIAFDHSKTKFALRGKHQNVSCAACHLGEIYRGLPASCNDCHVIQDIHLRRFGTSCQACHNEQKWKDAKFDHDTATRFPLRGRHAKATCQACHGSSVLTMLPVACGDCHAKQDVHKAQLGNKCGDCHGETAWRKDVVFDHGLTQFPLVGLHAVVACESCHTSAAFKDAGVACKDCHIRDDTHAGRFTPRCESCHSAAGWQRISFNHDSQTKFRLTGKHAKTGCYNCHVRKNVADASLPTDCFSCHAKQDVHRGKFGRDCARCHDTVTFSRAFIRQ